MATTIHVGIAFDQNYLAPFYALASSVLANNKGNSITIHAIVTGVPENTRTDIAAYMKSHGCDIVFYEIDEEDIRKYVLTSKWTSAVYYRLLFPFLVPQDIQRFLYIDTDTIVLNDLTALYNQPLGHYPVGAVYDNWVKTAPQLGITEEGAYFNSGVMLMDLPRWRDQKISEQAFDYLARYPERIKFVDQDALNAVLIGNWKHLDNRFNFMYSLIPDDVSVRELEQIRKSAVVVHFTLQRPWFMLCRNRFRSYYFYYLKHSPGRHLKRINDFSAGKLPAYVKQRLIELYNDNPAIKKIWRRLKQ